MNIVKISGLYILRVNFMVCELKLIKLLLKKKLLEIRILL